MARAPNEKALQAYELYKQGYKPAEIGKQMGVPVPTVRRWKSTSPFDWDTGEVIKRSDNKSDRSGKEADHLDGKQVDDKAVNEVVADEVSQVIENTDLTDKQRLFCLYYIKCFNATKAYKKAYGVGELEAMASGSRMLRNVKVKAEIESLKQNRLNQAMLKPEDVFQWYLDIATADMKDYVTFGNEVIEVKKDNEERSITVSYVNIKNADEVDGSLITEISKGKDGIKVKLADKMRAMDWISNHMDMATEEQRARIDKIRSEIEQNKNSSTEVVDDWISAITGEDVTADE